jgi:hypothetical protein
LKTALRAVCADPHIDDVSAEDLLGEYPAIQYVPRSWMFRIDLVTRLGEAFRFEDLEVQRVPFGPPTVSVVSP